MAQWLKTTVKVKEISVLFAIPMAAMPVFDPGTHRLPYVRLYR